MIAVVDYGAGNLRSVVNAFAAIGHRAEVTGEPGDLGRAEAIVLPGVGAFGDGMRHLAARGLIEPLGDAVIGKRVPFLGICLGLQFLAQTSDEFGEHKGLGWVDGVVRRIVPADPATKVPHMGWNEVTLVGDDPLFAGLGPEPVFYFLHSYYLDVAESASSIVTSTCWHGARLTASVRRDNVVAVQFHPEKSQEAGLRLLRNFVAEVGRARC